MKLDSKIFVTGHRGLIGGALVRRLEALGYSNILTAPRAELDLSGPDAVRWYFSCHKPDYVFHCAARVGGIQDNIDHPLEFLTENLDIQKNVFENAAQYGVERLIFLGSSCIYPKLAPQPLRPEYLLTGPFEKAVEAYGLAKTVGVKMCEYYQRLGHDFIAAMPCNIFGLRDSLDERNAHVIPGMMLRMHRAKVENAPTFTVWGDGSAKREFLFADDLANALILVMRDFQSTGPINTGSGEEISIEELSRIMAFVVGYSGEIVFDDSKPVGTPRKTMDNSQLRVLGWLPQVDFRSALEKTYIDMRDRL